MKKTPTLADPVFWLTIAGYVGLIAAWGYLLAAPAPRHKPRPAAEVTPDVYKIRWGHYHGTAVLYPNGAWECNWSNALEDRWYGIWRWNRLTRVLTVTEQKTFSGVLSDGIEWWVGLDRELKGTNGRGKWRHLSHDSYEGLPVELTRVKPAIPEQINAMPTLTEGR